VETNLPTSTVAELGIGTQAWAGRGEPDCTRSWRPAPDQPRSKPVDGFFTSAWDAARRTCPWLDHLRGHGNRGPEGRRLWLLDPDPDARLYVIDGLGAYVRLADEYPRRWDGRVRPTLYEANWYAMADPDVLPFEGVHAKQTAIENGGSRFRGSDIESTLWFRWSFMHVECAGAITDSLAVVS